jgi:hypothetical protein
MRAQQPSLLQNAYQLFKMPKHRNGPNRERAMRKSAGKPPRLDRDAAEAVALQGLSFLLAEQARAARFLRLTGIEPDEMRARVGSVELMLAVLEHLSGDESLLLVFAAESGIAPEDIGRAMALLDGPRA